MADLIKQARELCENATPGPWTITGTHRQIVVFGGLFGFFLCTAMTALFIKNTIQKIKRKRSEKDEV